MVHCKQHPPQPFEIDRWRPSLTRIGWRWLLALSCTLPFCAPVSANPATVLVLYSNNHLLPANIAFDRGLRAVLSPAVEINVEFLDYPRFFGPAYSETVTRFLREKYAAQMPALIIVGGENALEFLLENRDELFSGVPIVHAGVPAVALSAHALLPDDVVGVPVGYDFAATIAQALDWHPLARRLVLVTGASPLDHNYEVRLRALEPSFQDRVEIEFITGLETATLQKRLAQLDESAVVFTPGFFEDGAGNQYHPRESAVLVAGASGAPVYAPYDTFIGTGVVGGVMPSFRELGVQVGAIVGEILAGAAPQTLDLPEVADSVVTLDWQQVLRWKINVGMLPENAQIHFRTPGFFETYRRETLVGGALFLLQSALIAGLLLERRRRRGAELVVQRQRVELLHASRLALAGELTASIAHEINQPLAAILSNADAAALILDKAGAGSGEVAAILDDIRRDDQRASDVVNRLRAFLAHHEFERAPLDINEVAREVSALLRVEIARRNVGLELRLPSGGTVMIGDRIQVQQVLINLILNAMDAVAGQEGDRRIVRLSAEIVAGDILITVRDHGEGIDPENLGKLFTSFFTTKKDGMGLGLSIARTIVLAHGGRLTARNAPDGGAIFEVVFPRPEQTCSPQRIFR